MSHQDAKTIRLSDKRWLFSWWYVDNAANIDLMPYYSPYLRNARLDWHSIVIRPWHTLLAELTAWSYPKWIGSYNRTDPSNSRLVVRHNTDSTHKLYSITTAWVETSISTSSDISSNNRMTFTNVNDVIYCMNWSDNFGKLSGTTYTTPSTWVSNFAPAFSVVFNSSHRASWRSTNSNVVYKSVWDNYEDFNSTWSDTFTFQEPIVGLSANDESLFYFTLNTISVTGKWDIQDTAWVFTYTNRKLQAQEWALNHYTIVWAWNETYFVTPSLKICKIAKWQNIEWYEVLELSERENRGITKILSTLDTDQSNAYGVYLPKQRLIKWFFMLDWSTFNDLCIVYDIQHDAFLVDTQKYFYDSAWHDSMLYSVSMIEPKVYRDEYSQTDEDSMIPFEYRTKIFYFWDPTSKKILWSTRTLLDISELAELTQEILLNRAIADSKTIDSDNIDTSDGWLWYEAIAEYAIGEWEMDDEERTDYQETYIYRHKGHLNKMFRTFQLRRTNSTIAGKVRLKDVYVEYEQKPYLATDLTT